MGEHLKKFSSIFSLEEKIKDKKKIKLGKLNFYIIDDNYIKYLSQFDKHIAYNKNEKRPYNSIVLISKILISKRWYIICLFILHILYTI